MYNSLTFYYSNYNLKDGITDRCLNLNVPWQLEKSNEWLKTEHLQHQQWTSHVMRDYETSYRYEVHTFVTSKVLTFMPDPFYFEFTPALEMSSKLLYSQLTGYHTQSIFPGFIQDLSNSRGFQLLDWQKFTTLDADSFTRDPQPLQQLLPKFVAWFTFYKLYLSFYVRKVSLEEDGRVSEVFSNRLICHWLGSRRFESQSQGLNTPFIGPTQSEVHNHLKQLKEHINRMKAVSQATLIYDLNSVITRWVLVWGFNIRWSTLSYCEDRLRRLLQRWAKRRHPNKGWGWVCHKYWRLGPIATKCVFWLCLLNNVYDSSKKQNIMPSSLKVQLVKLFQMRLYDSVSVETSSFNHWQFFCVESKENLLPYTVMPLKKWRKSRSSDYFLLY